MPPEISAYLLRLHASNGVRVELGMGIERLARAEGGGAGLVATFVDGRTLACDAVIDPWVERHVIPFLDMVPDGLVSPRLPRRAAAEALAAWLAHDEAPDIVADWPEDLAQIAMLLVTGPGMMVPVPPLSLHLVPLHGFSPASNSTVPHNALHDARALRDHVMNHLE